MTVDGAAGAGPTNAAAGASASATTRACVFAMAFFEISLFASGQARADASAHCRFGRAFLQRARGQQTTAQQQRSQRAAAAHAPQKLQGLSRHGWRSEKRGASRAASDMSA